MQLSTFVSVFGLLAATATAHVADYEFSSDLVAMRIAARQEGGPKDDCHGNCGYSISGARIANYCTNSTWTALYNGCLECALTFDIWQFYGRGVGAAATACGLTAVPSPSGGSTNPPASTVPPPASSSVVPPPAASSSTTPPPPAGTTTGTTRPTSAPPTSNPPPAGSSTPSSSPTSTPTGNGGPGSSVRPSSTTAAPSASHSSNGTTTTPRTTVNMGVQYNPLSGLAVLVLGAAAAALL